MNEFDKPIADKASTNIHTRLKDVNGSGGSHSCGSHFEMLVQASDIAAAIVDSRSDEIIWCSTAWELALPNFTMGTSWTLACTQQNLSIQSRPGLGSVSQSTSSDSVQTQPDISVITLSNDFRGMVVNRQSENECLYAYMQEREAMFTKSRIISVSEMATTLAHEIKQPIATIDNILKGLSLGLMQNKLDPEKIKNAIEGALAQTRFTNQIIDRIRDFTQSRRPQQLELEINSLVQQTVSLMDWMLSANHCQLTLQTDEEQIHCLGDPIMLQQVLVNLIRNGIEAMNEQEKRQRTLTIEVRRSDRSVRISIRDTGHGLKVKEDTLFTPFITSKENGMGVGLNICRSFVELHQGRLWLSSNRLVGCTSHIELPTINTNE